MRTTCNMRPIRDVLRSMSTGTTHLWHQFGFTRGCRMSTNGSAHAGACRADYVTTTIVARRTNWTTMPGTTGIPMAGHIRSMNATPRGNSGRNRMTTGCTTCSATCGNGRAVGILKILGLDGHQTSAALRGFFVAGRGAAAITTVVPRAGSAAPPSTRSTTTVFGCVGVVEPPESSSIWISETLSSEL